MNLKYIVIYVAVFILITGAIYYFNSQYNNIFLFDFSEAVLAVKQSDSNTVAIVPIDTSHTLSLPDSSESVHQKDDTIKQMPVYEQISPPEQKKIAAIQTEVVAPEKPVNKADSSYTKWIKQTVTLLESMDAKKSSKIIYNYPEETAREILYKMKKKKAAEILAEFDPATANRLMRFSE